MKFNERYKEIMKREELDENFMKKVGRVVGSAALAAGVAAASHKVGDKLGKTLVKKGEQAAASAKATTDKIKAKDDWLAGKGPNPDDKVKKDKKEK